METPASAMNEIARESMTDTQMISVQVKAIFETNVNNSIWLYWIQLYPNKDKMLLHDLGNYHCEIFRCVQNI